MSEQLSKHDMRVAAQLYIQNLGKELSKKEYLALLDDLIYYFEIQKATLHV